MQTLRISEIFYSLQGESNTVGIPTIFIRLTGCPLRCSYCDTSYAFQGGEKKTLDEILEIVSEYRCNYVTVTGGEPLVQPACLDLLTQLVEKNYHVSLETSGALDVKNVDKRVVKVMDLKTPSSNELDKNLYSNLDYLSQQDQIKFVIGDNDDYEWSKNIIQQYQLDKRCHLLFSPVMDKQNPTELAEKILADGLPVRFQIQLHKLLWQDARGK